MTAVQAGLATRNLYAADAATDERIDLWFDDGLHASMYGSYLSALTLFGTLTGLDPMSLGADEIAARDLGIAKGDARALQRVASYQLGFAVSPVPEAQMGMMRATGLLLLGLRHGAHLRRGRMRKT